MGLLVDDIYAISAGFAKQHGYELVDINQQIIEGERQRVQNLIDDMGEEKYLSLEAGYTNDIIRELDTSNDYIIITGPIPIYGKYSVKLLKKHSVLIWLRCSRDDFLDYAKQMNKKLIELPSSVDHNELYDNRADLYSKHAEIIIDYCSDIKKVIKNMKLAIDEIKD